MYIFEIIDIYLNNFSSAQSELCVKNYSPKSRWDWERGSLEICGGLHNRILLDLASSFHAGVDMRRSPVSPTDRDDRLLFSCLSM